MRKLTITIALMLVVALAMPAFGAGHGSFSDVPSDHWAYDAINKLVAAGIVEGYPDGEFKGSQNMTRYEMAVMVSRALDNIVDEQEALANEVDEMGEGLTTGQAEDVTAIVKSLMEKNSQDELSDAQAEEVADIVDALTFELQAELKVLGADLDALGEDVDELEAKVDMMDVPEDNIEFGMDVTTTFEAASYGEDDTEKATTLALLADGDAIDEDPTADFSDFTSEKAFFQEYDLTVMGALGDAEFNLAVDTIANVFTDEDYPLDLGNSENDTTSLLFDSALLEVAYNDYGFQFGDLDDYGVAPYVLDEEDKEGMEMTASYMDFDITTFVLGNDQASDEEIYGVSASREMDFGTVTGRLVHFRDNDDILGAKNEINVLGLEVTDIVLTDAVTMGSTLAFSDWEDETNNADESDIYFNVNGEFVATDELTLDATVETAGEDFSTPYNDLEESGDYNMFSIGAEYVLNDNNTVTGGVKMVQPGDERWTSTDEEDELTFDVALENTYGDFTNNASLSLTQEDGFNEDHEVMVIELGTEYAWNETLTVGASLVNKNEEVAAGDYISYNYLKAFADKELAENITWNTEAYVMDGTLEDQYDDVFGTTYAGEDGQGTGMTTSLSVSF